MRFLKSRKTLDFAATLSGTKVAGLVVGCLRGFIYIFKIAKTNISKTKHFPSTMKSFPKARKSFPKILVLFFLLIAGSASAQRNWQQKPPGKLLQQSANCAGLAWGSAITGTAMMYIYTENGKTGFRDAGFVMYTGSLVLMANAWINLHHAGQVMEDKRVTVNANQYGVGFKIALN